MVQLREEEPLGPRILVADDDCFVRQAVCRYLEKQGYRVSAVTNGKDVSAALGTEHIAACLIDYHLPGKPIAELTAVVRRRAPETPIIIVTGDVSVQTERSARSLSPAFFFVKPFELMDVAAVLERIVGGGTQGKRVEDRKTDGEATL